MPIKTTDEGLKRVMGVSGVAFTIVNFVIGAGIFVLPAIVSIEIGAFGSLRLKVCNFYLSVRASKFYI